jgi:NAD(P)-dependent dehydrogenase (short-subunit alcohol dehydrogenase family)
MTYQPIYPDLKDQGVLITGGGSGIGAELVRSFVAQGAKVAFLDIAEEASDALVAEINSTAANKVTYFKTDLRDLDAVKVAIDQAAEVVGNFKVLVNNAAWDDRHDIDTVTPEYWDNNHAINLKQVFFVTQAALPYLRKSDNASIINFSSVSYLLHMGDLPVYGTAKAGLVGMTKTLAGRLGPENIRVNAIVPGMIITERQMQLWLTEEGIKKTTERQCLKRILLGKDITGPVLFLASESSGAISAQAIHVDGGLF